MHRAVVIELYWPFCPKIRRIRNPIYAQTNLKIIALNVIKDVSNYEINGEKNKISTTQHNQESNKGIQHARRMCYHYATTSLGNTMFPSRRSAYVRLCVCLRLIFSKKKKKNCDRQKKRRKRRARGWRTWRRLILRLAYDYKRRKRKFLPWT